MDIACRGDLRKDGLTHLLFELAIRYARSEDPEERNESREPSALAGSRRHADRADRAHRQGASGSREVVSRREGWEPNDNAEPTRPAEQDTLPGRVGRRPDRDATARAILHGRAGRSTGTGPHAGRRQGGAPVPSRPPAALSGRGFGGAARDVAETLGLVGPWAGSRGSCRGKSDFEEWTRATRLSPIRHAPPKSPASGKRCFPFLPLARLTNTSISAVRERVG